MTKSRDQALEQLKVSTFFGKNAAFLGCLLCGLTFRWDTSIETAAVTETTFSWNPSFFDSLSKEERKFILLHELWHIALLHCARLQLRDSKKWNIACDLKINANLKKDGYIAPEHSLFNPKYMDDDWSEEAIYNDLPDTVSLQGWGTCLKPSTEEETYKTITLVQQAATAAKMAGTDTESIENILNTFLKPKLPWKRLLHKYLLDFLEPEYKWSKPNRRFRDVYLPSLLPQEGRLTSVAMFLDTSGSITTDEIQRFVSEVKFVQEHLQPKQLHVIQFDTRIQEEKIYTESFKFKNIVIKGYGGTSYKPVRQYILKHKPTLSIIFTDLMAYPMDSVDKNKVLWVVSSTSEDGPFGDTIHVDL